MDGRQIAKALGAAIGLLAGCSGPEDPFSSGPAHATVTGLVTRPSGNPLAGVAVRVLCAGGSPEALGATDSSGRYLANLDTGADPFDGGSGHLLCHFTEPAGMAARAQRDTLVGFVRGPVLVTLQFIDLHEP